MVSAEWRMLMSGLVIAEWRMASFDVGDMDSADAYFVLRRHLTEICF